MKAAQPAYAGIMATVALPSARARLLRLQLFTLAWMAVEAAVAFAAAWNARSTALAAFGGDSLIELGSAGVVLTAHAVPKLESMAARTAGILLLGLAAVVAAGAGSALIAGSYARPSVMGMLLLLASAFIMPGLGRRKKRLAAETRNAALAADAVQSSMCGYLAWTALLGLGLNAVWGLGWADAAAALCLVPLIAIEGWRALHGDACSCCD